MKILYFAQLKETIGKDQDVLNFKSEISIKDLIEQLILKGEKYRKSFECHRDILVKGFDSLHFLGFLPDPESLNFIGFGKD